MILKGLTEQQAKELLFRWDFWSRPNQRAPVGAWKTWVILAGRGFGKTRSGAEWVRSCVCGQFPLSGGKYRRIALIAETAADARDVMVEGDSGILSVHPKAYRPDYEPSKRRLTWPNGAVATLYNATEPDQLRGPQHDLAWCDELAKWQYGRETWDMLQFGLRLGDDPRQCVTTTPRPIPLLKEIVRDSSTVVSKGSTYENRTNLAPKFFDTIISKYEGTRLGRQELNAEVLEDVAGSLWTREVIDSHRIGVQQLPTMKRVVVAIDPATKDQTVQDDQAAETGIIAAGLGIDGRGYILGDGSLRANPRGWARRALALYDEFDADAIIVETNQGGAMVASTIHSERSTVRVIEVHASKGKVTRAEPISALYEQGRISHVGAFNTLEDQMMLFTPFGIEGDGSPDRVDALVWGLTDLFPRLIRRTGKDKAFHQPLIPSIA